MHARGSTAVSLNYGGISLENLAASCLELRLLSPKKAALAMIKAQGGIFGWVSDSKREIAALSA
jgi:hypothetical protein